MDEYLTVPDVAKLLKVSESTVRRLVDSGTLPSVRLADDSWRRVERTKLDEYARSRGISLDWSVLAK